MAEAATKHAVVTGANKGIGYELVRQLASNGITVVLTARDEMRSLEAVEKLKQSGSDNVIFRRLDVADPATTHSLADFIGSHFGKLDILVNNAGINGVGMDVDDLSGVVKVNRAGISGVILEDDNFSGFVKVNNAAIFGVIMDGDALSGFVKDGEPIKWNEILTPTYELAEKCLQTNYYGSKRMCEVLIPLLQLSDMPRIVNVSSNMGELKNVTQEWAKGVFSDAANLTEERVDEVLSQYLNDYKGGSLETKGWPANAAAYIIIRSSYECLHKDPGQEVPKFLHQLCLPWLCQNRYDLYNTGKLTVEEGAG